MLVEIQTQLRGGGDDGLRGDDRRPPHVVGHAEELPEYRDGPAGPLSLQPECRQAGA